MSKTIRTAEYDGVDVEDPSLSYMILRAWMLYRVKRHGFADKKSARRKWYATELANLRSDIAESDIPDEKSAAASSLI
eukprot:7538305-Karenia_brevis.AAC.1